MRATGPSGALVRLHEVSKAGARYQDLQKCWVLSARLDMCRHCGCGCPLAVMLKIVLNAPGVLSPGVRGPLLGAG